MAVLIATASFNDPRFSRPQMAAIERTAEADPRALLLGLDRNLRPVVACRVGVPSVWRLWAIQRNGDPSPAECVDAFGNRTSTDEGRSSTAVPVLSEAWGELEVPEGPGVLPALAIAGDAL